MSLFTKKPLPQTLEQEHSQLVNDLVSLTKLLGASRQADILQKTEASRLEVDSYVRAIHTAQVRLNKLGEKINKRAAEAEATK